MEGKRFAEQLILLRAKHKYTQQRLADELGVTSRAVAMWESGESLPRKTMRINLAVLFELPPDYFLEDTDIDATEKAGEKDTVDKQKLFDEISRIMENSGLSEETYKNCTDVLRDSLFNSK